MEVNQTYDLLIIGGGPSGINAAIAAKKAGLSHIVIEKGVLTNSLFHFPTNMTFFSTSKKLEIGDIPFISHSDKPSRSEALEYYRRIVEAWDLNVHYYERVENVNKQEDGSFQISTSKGTYHSRFVIVSTGFYDLPNLMNIPGEDLPKVKHYYDEVHYYIGQKVLVVGGANSACDVALECWQKGADVTMAVRESELYQRVKYWILPNIENRIKEGSIKAHFNTTVEEIKPHSVILRTPEGSIEIENDFVLAMTGYQPDYSFLGKLGIDIQSDEFKTPFFNEETMETNIPGIYLAGVVAGGMKTNRYFIENTRDQGDKIIKSILGKK